MQMAGFTGVSALFSKCISTKEEKTSTKYIQGSWFEFQHHNKKEGIYWNPTCASFSAEQWDTKIKEMADLLLVNLRQLTLLRWLDLQC